MSHERIVIVGFGWVGQANALALAKLGFGVSYFDPVEPPQHYHKYASIYSEIPRLKEITANDSADTWYVVCVGDRVSEDGVQDISNIRHALESLRDVKGGVILRSTVLPDSLEKLEFDYYVPEFLHEKKAVEECIEPYLFVIGARKDAPLEPSFVSLWRERAHKVFEGTPQEASLIKYLSNLWNALRISFVNEFGDAIGRPSDEVHLKKIERIIDFLFDHRNYLRYGRAFGGHCLPKDSRAFIRAYARPELRLALFSGMYESNTHHEKLQVQYPLLPEWYSEWQDRHISGWRALSELWYAIKKHTLRPFRSLQSKS